MCPARSAAIFHALRARQAPCAGAWTRGSWRRRRRGCWRPRRATRAPRSRCSGAPGARRACTRRATARACCARCRPLRTTAWASRWPVRRCALPGARMERGADESASTALKAESRCPAAAMHPGGRHGSNAKCASCATAARGTRTRACVVFGAGAWRTPGRARRRARARAVDMQAAVTGAALLSAVAAAERERAAAPGEAPLGDWAAVRIRPDAAAPLATQALLARSDDAQAALQARRAPGEALLPCPPWCRACRWPCGREGRHLQRRWDAWRGGLLLRSFCASDRHWVSGRSRSHHPPAGPTFTPCKTAEGGASASARCCRPRVVRARAGGRRGAAAQRGAAAGADRGRAAGAPAGHVRGRRAPPARRAGRAGTLLAAGWPRYG